MTYLKPDQISDEMVNRGAAHLADGEPTGPFYREMVRGMLTAALCDRRRGERRAEKATGAQENGAARAGVIQTDTPYFGMWHDHVVSGLHPRAQAEAAVDEDVLRKRGEDAEERVKARLAKVIRTSSFETPEAAVETCGGGVEHDWEAWIQFVHPAKPFWKCRRCKARTQSDPHASGRQEASETTAAKSVDNTIDTRTASQDQSKEVPEVSEGMKSAGADAVKWNCRTANATRDELAIIFKAMYQKHLEERGQ